MSLILFEKSFASHEKSKFWSKLNGDINPESLSKSSHKKYWFECSKCNHNFEMGLNRITNSDSWCLYCSSSKLCNENNCKKCYNKSFASQEKSKFFSKLNDNINPRYIFKSSQKKYWFDCPTCNHTFESKINSISQGYWCPYCCFPPQKLCENILCKLCFDNSFASNEKSKFWSKINGDIVPRQKFKMSNKKFWFECNICLHTFESALHHISFDNIWCSYCSNSKLCDEKNCDKCYEKSFASFEKSKYWNVDKNKNIKPREIFKSCNNKFWFDCPMCKGTFETALNDVKKGNWCPFCKNKTELKLYKNISTIYPEIIRQYKVEWCKNTSYLRFDFFIPELNIIIELDGPQHFRQISNWLSPDNQHKNDKYKEKCANDNNCSIIRILQEDVWLDKYNWCKELIYNIDEIKNGDDIVNIYLCKNNEYDNF